MTVPFVPATFRAFGIGGERLVQALPNQHFGGLCLISETWPKLALSGPVISQPFRLC